MFAVQHDIQHTNVNILTDCNVWLYLVIAQIFGIHCVFRRDDKGAIFVPRIRKNAKQVPRANGQHVE